MFFAWGAVIRGETAHFTYICECTTYQLAAASADRPVPVMFGVLMTDMIAQVTDRAGDKSGNRGDECATFYLSK